jgi:hypothetical protein
MSASAERCSQIIREFDNQGWHRTATAVDEQSGEWLVGRLRALGLEPEVDRFPFYRVDPEPASVTVGETVIGGYPLIDSVLPPPGTTFSGPIVGERSDGGGIALARFDQHSRDGKFDAMRRKSFDAIVVAVEGFLGAFTLLNAWGYDEPYGPPVVQVPHEAWTTLDAARRAGERVTVKVGACRSATTAANIVARMRGPDSTLAPLVVLTPRSGWWYCAGERGGGIAVLLEVAKAVETKPLHRDIVFVATTGHELGFLGVKRYLDRFAKLATDALFWVHLGANVGAAESRLVVRSANERLLEQALSADFQDATFESSKTPVGEASIVHAHGGRFVSLVGAGFPRFHSTADRWPDAIDPKGVAACGDAVVRLLHHADAGL